MSDKNTWLYVECLTHNAQKELNVLADNGYQVFNISYTEVDGSAVMRIVAFSYVLMAQKLQVSMNDMLAGAMPGSPAPGG